MNDAVPCSVSNHACCPNVDEGTEDQGNDVNGELSWGEHSQLFDNWETNPDLCEIAQEKTRCGNTIKK